MEECCAFAHLGSSLKRSRSPELKLAQMRSALHDDVLTDNMRAQKRYLSQAMATDLDNLNMTGAASADPAACTNNSYSLDTNNDASMCSSSMMISRDDSCNTATPQSKRQRRLPPLEVPDSVLKDSASSCSHRLSESVSGRSQRISQQTPNGQRSRDEFDKPPVSPNDPCLGMDLRKAALLRSLMLATDPPNQSSNRRQGPASNTRRATRAQQNRLATCDRMSEGNASTDMDVSMNSDADCSPSLTPAGSPDRTTSVTVHITDTSVAVPLQLPSC